MKTNHRDGTRKGGKWGCPYHRGFGQDLQADTNATRRAAERQLCHELVAGADPDEVIFPITHEVGNPWNHD